MTEYQNELRIALTQFNGMSPKAIAAILVKNRIKGLPGTTGRCPLAMHMHITSGGQYVVGQNYIMRRVGNGAVKVKTPENLAAFVRMFDKGQFAELMMPPPRCTNAGGKNKGKKNSGIRHKRGTVRLHLAREAGRDLGNAEKTAK